MICMYIFLYVIYLPLLLINIKNQLWGPKFYKVWGVIMMGIFGTLDSK